MKLLIDVSHIIGWAGNLTGIERTEYNVIKHYYETPDAEFIGWNDMEANFQPVDRLTIKRTIIERTSESEQQASAESRSKTIFQKAKRRLSRAKRAAIHTSAPEGTVIILAGLWDNAGYIEGIEQLSQKYDLIHVVYDMIPLTQRGYVVDYLPAVFENYMYKLLPLCKAILAISESTARDTKAVLEAKGLSVPRIMTFRLGDEVSRATKAVRPAKADDAFVLSVGTVEARKNHMLLYYAYKQLLSQKQELPQLIIVGKRGWLSSDFQYVIEYDGEIKDKIIILDKVTDSELRWLYENCLFTVFPSFYEGWGLPVAESLNYGKVTLSSNTSSMPEVGGKAADYFSPFSSEQLAKLLHIYTDSATRKSRQADIAASYHATEWTTATKRFAEQVQQLTDQAG